MESAEAKAAAQQIEWLVGYLLLNPAIRQEFLKDPGGVAAQLNVKLTQEQINHIGQLNHKELEEYAGKIDEEIGASPIGSWIKG
jgi:hypothetical protein